MMNLEKVDKCIKVAMFFWWLSNMISKHIIISYANIYLKKGIMQNIVVYFNIYLTFLISDIFGTFNKNKM